MSIASEIQRLQGVKSDILEAIANKGVTVPEGSALADCPELIGSIGGGGGGNQIKIGAHYYNYVLMPDGKKWLAQNLDLIFPTLVVGASSTSDSEPRANYYDNNQAMYTVFGGTKPLGLLYNQKAVKYLVDHPSVIQGCHVPTTTEWTNLFASIGTNAVASKKIKAVDNSYGTWPSGWGGDTDEYGFNALPGGRYDGSFGIPNECFYRTVSGTYIELRPDNSRIDSWGGNENYGYTIRLIVD